MKKRAADIIMETLVENAITDAFCVVGGGAMFLNNALALNKKIKTVFNHHEQASSMACEGYARLSGKPALCCVTSGPGGTNAITGVMGAYQDNIPMVIISGQVRYDTTVCECNLPIRQRGEQEFDIINSVRNMTKYAKMLTDAGSIRQEVQKAVDIAMSGRRGPVWLDIPLNIQNAQIEESDLLPILPPPATVECSEQDAQKIFNILKAAKRPCILAGSAIRSADVRDDFLSFLNKWQMPVVSAACVADNLYNDHPLYFGTTGMIGTRSGNFVIQNADVILVLGSRLGYKQTGFAQENFASKAKIIMVDIDEGEPKKPGLRINTFIHSDLKSFFEKASTLPNFTVADEWLRYCNKLKERFGLFGDIEHQAPKERVSAQEFWEMYYHKEKADNIVMLGNSSCVHGKLNMSAKTKNQRVLVNINCGSMGCDIPPAIGAAVAAEKEVTLVTGDGSFMMNIQELATIAHNKLPVKIILFSNEGYGAIRQTCKTYFKGFNFGCDSQGLSFPNFAKLADSFGFPYRLCKNTAEIENAIDWINGEKSFAFLEVLQKLDNPTAPRLMSRLKDDGTFEKPSFEDMYPFIDKEEIKKFML